MNAARFSAWIAVAALCAISAHAQDNVQLKSSEAEAIAIALKTLKSSAPKDERAGSIYRRLRRYRVDVDRQDSRTIVVVFIPDNSLRDDRSALEGNFLFDLEPLHLIKVSYGR